MKWKHILWKSAIYFVLKNRWLCTSSRYWPCCGIICPITMF
uniref:Uncharacterized protein n=1 Tax=Arundo donax TaxID=35708 RepID=A0A0A9Q704_ARUDO